MKALCAVLVLLASAALAQPGSKQPADPFQSLAFLQGTWTANASGDGGKAANGTYTFQLELAGRVLVLHSTYAGCKGPADFNCQHGDLLYIYPEAGGLRAIYFDNEGHVIHYGVTTPEPGTAVLVSDASTPGPRFRLIYQLQASTMSGRFQIQMPGRNWTSYIEWTGTKQ